MHEELLAFVQDNAKWWDDAATYFESHPWPIGEQQAAEWQLLAAVYRERAKLHLDLMVKLRNPVGRGDSPIGTFTSL